MIRPGRDLLALAASVQRGVGFSRGVLYDTWIVPDVLRFDQVVHAFGSAAATWAGLAGLGKGALNEVFEFLSTLTLPDTHVGDGTNTSWDLVFDVVGCVAAGLFLVRAGMARRTVSARPSGSDRDRLLDDVGLLGLD